MSDYQMSSGVGLTELYHAALFLCQEISSSRKAEHWSTVNQCCDDFVIGTRQENGAKCILQLLVLVAL